MNLKSIALFLALVGWALSTAAQPDLVVIVRHAEKATLPLDDPPLSAAGEARAAALADALMHAGITAIITTQFQRTRATAEVLAQRIGIQPQVVDAGRGETEAHVEEVAEAVRAQRGRVLVVGHSNTVARLIAALDGPSLDDLCESSYGHAFVLVPGSDEADLLRMRYGAADPPPEEACQ